MLKHVVTNISLYEPLLDLAIKNKRLQSMQINSFYASNSILKIILLLGHKNLKSLDMYNRGLTITEKLDVAMCLIKPKTRGGMKRIIEPVESNDSESESDLDMSEPEETNADADEDHDYVPRPAKKICCTLAHSSIGSNDKSASEPEETNAADDVPMPVKKIRSTLAPSSIGSKSAIVNPLGGSSKRFQFKKSDTNGKGVKNKMLRSVVHTQEDTSDCESIFEDGDFDSNATVDHDYASKPVKKIHSTLAPPSIGSNDKSVNPLEGSRKKYDFKFKKLDTNGKVVKKKMSVVHTQEDNSDCESIFEDEDFGSNKSTKSMKFGNVETKIDVVKVKEPKKVYTVVHTQEENMVDAQEIFDNDFGIEEKENQAPQQGGGNKIHFVRPHQQMNHDGSLMDFMKRQQQLQMASEISRRTEQTTVQMLVQASLRREEEAKKREEKLLALLDRT